MRRWQQIALWIAVVCTGVISGALVERANGDLGGWVVSIAVLVVTAITLHFVAPTPGELVVERQHELGLSDLIFFVYPQPERPGEQQVPRDYLLQLHVAVANTGRRKAVLSQLSLTSFVDASGAHRYLPEGVMGPLNAHRWTLYRLAPDLASTGLRTAAQLEHPPFTLEPDDVVTLRFRLRRGIDWSDRWTLPMLEQFAKELAEPVVGVEGELVYRRGKKVVRTGWKSDLDVVQQALYVQRLVDVTQGFTVRPMVPEQRIDLE